MANISIPPKKKNTKLAKKTWNDLLKSMINSSSEEKKNQFSFERKKTIIKTKTLWFGINIRDWANAKNIVSIELFVANIMKNGRSGSLLPKSYDNFYSSSEYDQIFAPIIKKLTEMHLLTSKVNIPDARLTKFSLKIEFLPLILSELTKLNRLFLIDKKQSKASPSKAGPHRYTAKYFAPNASQILTFDHFGSWSLAINIYSKRRENKKILCLEGHLERDSEKRHLSDLMLLFSEGLFLYKNQFAFFTNKELLPFTQFLNSDGLSYINWEDKDHFLAQIYQLKRTERPKIADNIAWKQIQASPKVNIYFTATYSDDNVEIIGKVEFDYPEEKQSLKKIAKEETEIPLQTKKKIYLKDKNYESKTLETLQGLPIEFIKDDNKAYALFPLADEEEEMGIEIACHFKIAEEHFENFMKKAESLNWNILTDKGKKISSAKSFSINAASGIDWLEVKGNITFGKHQVFMPEILKSAKRESLFIKLSSSECGFLKTKWKKELQRIQAMTQGNKKNKKSIKISKAHVLSLDQCLSEMKDKNDKLKVSLDASCKKLKKKLLGLKGIKPLNPPKTFNGQLRSYQKEGLGWLSFLHQNNFHGCLADDMGLGKTIQLLAFLEKIRVKGLNDPNKKISLVVMPKSLVENWLSEKEKFTPKLKAINYTGPQRRVLLKEKKQGSDFIITTYGTLLKDVHDLRKIKFHLIILDESQAIKNEKAKISKTVKILSADRRISLTGTPIENHLGELFSLFEFLDPYLFDKQMVNKFSSLKSSKLDERKDDLTFLAKGLSPLILRRTKDEVLKDLPKKTVQTIYCEMSPEHQRIYNKLKKYYQHRVLNKVKKEGVGKSKFSILEALMRLRQVSNHPGLVDNKKTVKHRPFTKIEYLIEKILPLVKSEKKILIFSQFTSFLKIIQHFLEVNNIKYLYMDGKTKNRKQLVDQFQSDKTVSVFYSV